MGEAPCGQNGERHLTPQVNLMKINRHALIMALVLLLMASAAYAGVGRWFSASNMLDDRTFSEQVAYAAGAYDAYSSLISLSESGQGAGNIIGLVKDQMVCMDRKGDKAGDFGRWAIQIWRSNISYRGDNAASLLLAKACN